MRRGGRGLTLSADHLEDVVVLGVVGLSDGEFLDEDGPFDDVLPEIGGGVNGHALPEGSAREGQRGSLGIPIDVKLSHVPEEGVPDEDVHGGVGVEEGDDILQREAVADEADHLRRQVSEERHRLERVGLGTMGLIKRHVG